MKSTRPVWRAVILGVLGALIATQVVVGAMAAAAQPPGGRKIGPNQQFGALVNGRNGLAAPVVIQMACFGPLKPGETGHPLAGQTVTVFRPEAIVGNFGNTGANGHEIGAFFGPPPPSTGSTPTSGPVFFRRYKTKKIPTSEVLPCAGNGHVTFVPLPMSPGSEIDVVVPVTYVGQP
jgi:hypothetical protein